MAWEWSHSAEAYENARLNVHDLDHGTLAVVYAEIKADKGNEGTYEEEVQRAKDMPHDILADSVWAFSEEHRTCDNGGHNAHICPHGCHTVSFDRKEKVDA